MTFTINPDECSFQQILVPNTSGGFGHPLVGCHIIHKPTGIYAQCTEEGTYWRNQHEALQVLQHAVEQYKTHGVNQNRTQEAQSNDRALAAELKQVELSKENTRLRRLLGVYTSNELTHHTAQICRDESMKPHIDYFEDSMEEIEDALRKRANSLLSVQTVDDHMVDRLSAAMKAKMKEKAADGYDGWHVISEQKISNMLHEHILKSDPIDVANFCGMLFWHGYSINADPKWKLSQSFEDSVAKAFVQLNLNWDKYHAKA